MDRQVVRVNEITNSSNIEDKQSAKSKPKFNFMELLNVKNLKIIALVVLLIVALVLFLGISNQSNSKNTSSTNDNTYGYQSTFEYCKQLEEKLEKLLSSIDGAGKVRVMISVDGSPELVFATNADVKSNSNSSGTSTTSTSTPIIVNMNGNTKPLVLTEKLPPVKGVIVISSGASNVSIKLDILKAVSTLLDISTDKINVLKGS